MQVSANHTSSIYTNPTSQNKSGSGLSATKFMEQVDPKIVQIFEEMSAGWDEDLKLKRAMSLSLHLTHPMFLNFQEGYPEGMPKDLQYALESQKETYTSLRTEEEKSSYMLSWMINRIGHEISDDPEFKNVLIDIRERYNTDNSKEIGTEIIETQEDETDYALEHFKDSLRTKGALKFLLDFNLEKIEEKVKEYKEKLLKEMGDSPENLAEIEKMVENYRKKLLEEMQEKTAKEKEDQKGTLVFSVESFVKMLLEEGTNKENSPLKDILQK
ncbi:MAG: hypothetical protein RBS14_01120 [Atribacterota bacterium]|jgi:DNA-binding transcriptional MerR regulator|nr:hypothetical protein [Atribacterota bacterium]